jgi:hypothetical protein
LVCARVEIGGDIFSALEMAGLIHADEMQDRERLGYALSLALSEWADEKISSRVTSVLSGRAHSGFKGDRTR